MLKVAFQSALISLTLFFGGCASGPDLETLELDNVFDLQQQRKAAKAAEQALKQKMAETQAPVKSLQEIMDESSTDPAEVAFLSLPEAFYRLDKDGLQDPIANELVARNFLQKAVIWRAKNWDLYTIAGMTPLNQEHMGSLTESGFMKELTGIGEKFNDLYKNNYDSRATFNIARNGNFWVLNIVSKYLNGKHWWTDLRYIFFYKSEYHLTVTFAGESQILDPMTPALTEAVAQFQSDLDEYFPQGLKLLVKKPLSLSAGTLSAE